MRFTAIDEPLPGPASRAWLERGRPFWERWYGDARRAGQTLPDPAACRRRIADAMPELVAGYDAACELVPDDPLAQVVLAQVDPPPMIPAGCTVRAVRAPEPALVRNYDFHPEATSGVLLRSCWGTRTVLGMGEGVTGYLDGVNDAGVAGAITFGGRHVHGPGFGILLILRYVLEIAGDLAEARAALAALPCAWSQNVLVADRHGDGAVAHLSPDRGNRVVAGEAVTNHQSDEGAGAGSRRRLERACGLDGGIDAVVDAFHRAPLLGADADDWMLTLYTAVYRPGAGQMELRWPGQRSWVQSIDRFEAGERTVRLAQAAPAHPEV